MTKPHRPSAPARAALHSAAPWIGLSCLLAACAEPAPAGLVDDSSPVAPADGGVDASPTPGDGDFVPQGNDGSVDPSCGAGSPDQDFDRDGFSVAAGDCNDCSPQVNPGAFDVPGNEHDEDCSGGPSAQNDCEADLPIAPGSADDAARAIGLCQFPAADSRQWGVLSARFTSTDGTGELDSPLQAGVLPGFGSVKPVSGSKLLALSSGVARVPGQPDYTPGCDDFLLASQPCPCDPLDLICLLNCPPPVLDPKSGGDEPPAGYPRTSPECPDSAEPEPGTLIHNEAALELKLRVPTNAHGLRFDSAFFTAEWPNYICATVNDFFVVFKTPHAPDAADANILFDRNGEPVGLNSGLLAACDPAAQQPPPVRTFACEQGTGFLAGTGYGPHDVGCVQDYRGINAGASTGWLRTTTPVEPGQEITLLFSVWDTADATLDSSVIVDNFTWLLEEVEETETAPIVF